MCPKGSPGPKSWSLRPCSMSHLSILVLLNPRTSQRTCPGQPREQLNVEVITLENGGWVGRRHLPLCGDKRAQPPSDTPRTQEAHAKDSLRFWGKRGRGNVGWPFLCSNLATMLEKRKPQVCGRRITGRRSMCGDYRPLCPPSKQWRGTVRRERESWAAQEPEEA